MDTTFTQRYVLTVEKKSNFIQNKEKELVQRAKFFAKILWHRNFNLPIKINKRFRVTLGLYYYGHSIELSHELLEDEYLLNDTLLHELCHWYCDTSFKESKDGSDDFERELRRIGATSTRTTDMNSKMVYDLNVLKLNKLYKKSLTTY